MEMAKHKRAIFATEMHTVTFAVAEEGTGIARFLFFHPGAVTIRFEAVLPNFPEMVLVDITLVVFATNRGASGDVTIDEDGSDRDTG